MPIGGDLQDDRLGAVRCARRTWAAALVLWVGLLACSNNPYPEAFETSKTLYSYFAEAPKTLDPATAYTTAAHRITGSVYGTLLDYHFLKRPLELIPGLAETVPKAEVLGDGRTRYRFVLREGLRFALDPCFELGEPGARTRPILASDVAFQLARIADPGVASPVIEPFSNLDGFTEFGTALMARREADEAFAARPVHEQYAALGGIRGVQTPGERVLEVTLARPYPQILYWFAMEFSTPVPWEAVAFYDGREGRPRFDDHPVGSGPFVLAEYEKQSRIVLARNENWHGVLYPERHAPGTVYPGEGNPGDAAVGLLDDAGKSLPFLDRVVFVREKESIPSFNKFIQGYYDATGIVKESFDAVIRGDGLSPEMAARGMTLEKSVSPSVFYIGFNMNDPVVGSGSGERGRKLRQAMSLSVDTTEWLRIFLNGRGVPAQSLLPPGIYGYDPEYRNPYRQVDLARARQLLAEAGYPGGVDPETGEPLRLTFDTSNTSTAGRIQLQFYTNTWAEIGLDVRIDQSNYNQFQEKIRNGAYQVFQFGWYADYPDPENFLFLLWSEMGRAKGGGPNAANFSDARFDELFLSMKVRENGPRRLAEIREMQSILERERPWIELFHGEDYSLMHGWVRNVKPMGLSIPTYEYRDIDVGLRAEKREAWNDPVLWPVYAIALAALAVLLPAIRTYLEERQ